GEQWQCWGGSPERSCSHSPYRSNPSSGVTPAQPPSGRVPPHSFDTHPPVRGSCASPCTVTPPPSDTSIRSRSRPPPPESSPALSASGLRPCSRHPRYGLAAWPPCDAG